MIGLAQARNGDFDGAMETIWEIDDRKSAAKFWYGVAMLQASQGHFEKAMASVEIVKDPDLIKDPDVASFRKFAVGQIQRSKRLATKVGIEDASAGWMVFSIDFAQQIVRDGFPGRIRRTAGFRFLGSGTQRSCTSMVTYCVAILVA